MTRHDRISRRTLLASLYPAGRLLFAWQDTKFATEIKVVNLLATVRNKHGDIVSTLTKDDFLLDEDGRPQSIRYFSRETDLPLTLGLLVDTSMSQRRVLGEERAASHTFFRQVLREDKDQAFVIHFDHEVELLQDLTSSRPKLESAIDQIETPARPQWAGGRGPGGGGGSRGPGSGGRGRGGGMRGGMGTALYDSVLLASDELMKKQSGRKALVVLTDGMDHGSKVSLDTAIESAQRADTLVYSILFADTEGFGGRGFGGPGMGRRGGMGGGGRGRMPERTDGKKILERLSKETGGGFFDVSKKQPIDKVYARIQEELRNQYSIGYQPERTDAAAGYRKIHLTTRKKDLIVQTREGYYAS